MTEVEARKLILHAIYNDSWLYSQLILKGGNAISMIYKIGNRTSLDLDFSISQDFKDLKKVSDRIKNAIERTFVKKNILVFDFYFYQKPKNSHITWWGGYRAEFKLISKTLANKLDHNIEKIRRQSMRIDSGSQRRKYSIDISKFEYIENYEIKQYEGINILVYSPVLLAVEKLRALLQQHPKYRQISAETKKSRSRDLYDIWIICEHFSINLEAHIETVKAVFNAKKVNMKLLNDLEKVKDLHYESWADVELSVSEELEDYYFYFDYVNRQAKALYSKWIKNSP